MNSHPVVRRRTVAGARSSKVGSVVSVLMTCLSLGWVGLAGSGVLESVRVGAGRGSGSAGRQSPRCRGSGRRRSSQPGIHQFLSPSSCMVAGTRTRRMIVASMTTAAAMPIPMILRKIWSSSMKAPNTAVMISAAAVMTLAVAARPSATAVRVSRALQVLLADPGEQEDLVVHRQAEEDREHHHRDERRDRGGRGDAEQLPEPAALRRRRRPRRTRRRSTTGSAPPPWRRPGPSGTPRRAAAGTSTMTAAMNSGSRAAMLLRLVDVGGGDAADHARRPRCRRARRARRRRAAA